jgi:hypothetical protein
MLNGVHTVIIVQAPALFATGAHNPRATHLISQEEVAYVA